jgi:RNA polymerase sigma factor (TIGR02999 family)
MADTRPLLDHMFSATYEELRRLAATVSAGEGAVTLNPTALVNEAYVKLVRSLRLRPESALHFKRIAARAMRQVLVEAARRRQADKRGGGSVYVTLGEDVGDGITTSESMLALDAALDDLQRMEPRQAQMIEYRFFAGLDVAETAQVLGVSEATVQRDWRAARAWLGSRLRAAP